jgi:hypothetical protein
MSFATLCLTRVHVFGTWSKDRFEIDDNLRIEFSRNGKPRLEPVAQQLVLKFDYGESVNVRIECVSDVLIIKKVNTA